jgi:hypothetical protein
MIEAPEVVDAHADTEPPPKPVHVRHDRDFYRTPEWVTSALLRALDLPKNLTIYDPCAGDGAILNVCRARGYENVHGTDIEPRKELDIAKKDFLQTKGHIPNIDVCIMNPPFSHLREFVTRALQAFGPRCTLAILMRDGAASTKRSKPFMVLNPDRFPLVPRPSFTENGRSDRTTYSWFVWRPGPPPPFGRTKTLYRGDITQEAVPHG